MKVENSIEEIAEVDEDRAIREIKRELADEDRKEYMSRWFAKDLEILIYYIEKLQKENEQLRTEVKRYKNMYEAEYQIHLVRNEQLDRKQKAIIKCNELENENEELKKEIKSWKKYSDEQEENIIEKNNIICNLEFQIEKQQKEIKEKNKIINLMAEHIFYNQDDTFPLAYSIKDTKGYFENKAKKKR